MRPRAGLRGPICCTTTQDRHLLAAPPKWMMQVCINKRRCPNVNERGKVETEERGSFHVVISWVGSWLSAARIGLATLVATPFARFMLIFSAFVEESEGEQRRAPFRDGTDGKKRWAEGE